MMMCKVKGFKTKRKALLIFLLGGITVFWQLAALATQSVTLGWDPTTDPNVAGYNLYYGTASHVYASKVSVGNVTNKTIAGLVEGTTYFFAATTSDVSGEESTFSNEASYAVPPAASAPPAVFNEPPTLNALGNVTINENAVAKTMALSGITSGVPNQNQPLTVTASSSNPALIPNPSVNYTSPNQTGTLTFAPVTYASGTAVITVTVNDGAATNNIITKTFTVIVNHVNQPPTLDPISNVSINENAASQTVALSGITSGAPNQKQTLTVTARSSNPFLIPNPTVSYTSPNTTGTLTFKPVAGATGTATVTVTILEFEWSDWLIGNLTVTKTFTVTVVGPIVSNPASRQVAENIVATTTTMKPAAMNAVVATKTVIASQTVGSSAAATLTQTVFANGQYSFNVSGTPGSQYVVQTSNNLMDWVSAETNTSPFTFVDANAGQYNQRFYRAVGQ